MQTYLVWILVVAALALTAAAGYGFTWSESRARAKATGRMSYEADQAASSVSAALATATKQVGALAAQPGLGAVFDNPAGCTLQTAGAGPFRSVRLDIVSRGGQAVCSSGKAAAVRAPGVHAGSDWLRDVLDSSGPVTDWQGTDAATGRPALVVAAPIFGGDRVVGAVVVFLHVDSVAGAMAGEIVPAEHASVVLVDRRTHDVLSTSKRRSAEAAGAFPDSRTKGEWADVDGTDRLFGSADVPGSSWRVYAGAQRSAVLAGARGTLGRQALVGVVALLVLAAAVWLLNRRVAGPLRDIIDAVGRASHTPEGVRLRKTGTVELVTLAREFNAMLDVRAGHEAQLLHQATHDPLTGLPNRTLLRDRLDHALLRDRSEASLALLFLGLNRFKTINDSLGHETGDRVLVEVAERLSTALRPGDTLARFGGDEFVVLCENIPSEDAAGVAARLHRCLAQPFRGDTDDAHDLIVTASVGIAVADGCAPNGDRLLREAASAMTQAKATGRELCVFDDDLRARATQRLRTEHALQQALEHNQLMVHYQPVLDVATGRIVGAEALVRWQHPDRGLVPPMEFIPLAEETGQIAAIGRFVLTRACQQAADWEAAGHPLRISVNVSVDQFRQGDFPGVVRQVLTDSGLAPEQLCLEITESSLIREAGHGVSALTQLRALGVHLSIDDFGTGYSSLSYLHTLPVDELKIDRSFISRLDRDSRETHLVEGIIGMARALGLLVVAEGVETGKQLEFLADLGCPLAQGYLIARPQPAEQILTLLTAKHADGVAV